MNTFEDYFVGNKMAWIDEYNLRYTVSYVKPDKGSLIIIFNDKLCLKIYDRCGHGFEVNINVAEKYDEHLYENDSFNLSWAYKYFNIGETASFSDRSENQYLKSLPKLITDLKNIIPQLIRMTSSEWDEMVRSINKEATKHFS